MSDTESEQRRRSIYRTVLRAKWKLEPNKSPDGGTGHHFHHWLYIYYNTRDTPTTTEPTLNTPKPPDGGGWRRCRLSTPGR